jgi:RNA polymerase sigma-70 factor (ECF subfamily)
MPSLGADQGLAMERSRISMDQRLKNRIAKGESEAFVELHVRLGKPLLQYLTSKLGRTDAEDVFQEVFVRLVRYRNKLARGKKLEAYIFSTARNEAIRWQKKHRRRFQSLAHMADQAKNCRAHHLLETNNLIAALMLELSDDTAEIIRLKAYSELTFSEIGKLLKQNESTVASRYRRGVKKMQNKLQEIEQHRPAKLEETHET